MQFPVALTGAADKIAATSSAVWAVPMRGVSVFRVSQNQEVDEYKLPTFRGTTSVPVGADPAKATIVFPPSSGSMVATADGFVVLAGVPEQLDWE